MCGLCFRLGAPGARTDGCHSDCDKNGVAFLSALACHSDCDITCGVASALARQAHALDGGFGQAGDMVAAAARITGHAAVLAHAFGPGRVGRRGGFGGEARAGDHRFEVLRAQY